MAFNQNMTFTNLGTITIGCPETATYNIDVKLQLPIRTFSGSDSAVVTVLKHNTTTLLNGLISTITVAQGFN